MLCKLVVAVGSITAWAAIIIGLVTGIMTLSMSTAGQNITKVEKLLIDTDAGVDDAFAILMALGAENPVEGPQVLAITCVNGNTYVDNVALNVLKTLKVVDRLDIPVYKGAPHPLLMNDEKTDYFGKDGFGDFEYPDPPSINLINDTHAVTAMINLVKANPGEVTLLALGPLTNIALAIRLYPSFLEDLQQLIILGGCAEGMGNYRLGVEFNFAVDPAANYVVFNSSQTKPVILVPCETTLKAKLPMEFRTSLNSTNNSKMWLLNKAEASSLNTQDEYWYCADALAASVALTSGGIVTRSNSYFAEAIFEGQLTRGMIILDYNNVLNRTSNVHLIQDVNVDTYKELILKYLA